MKIAMGSIVTAKVGEMEEKTKDGRSTRNGKEVMGCFQACMGKKKFIT